MLAVEKAEEALRLFTKVYSIGEIVHNPTEVSRLAKLGLETVSHDDIASLEGCKLLIRAHGEPPETFALAAAHNVEVIDATCPVVAHLQRRVVEAHRRMKSVGGEVVILGKKGHAEVLGLAGQVGGDVLVVESEADLDSIDFNRPVTLLSQTTQSPELFERVATLIRQRARAEVDVCNTVCARVASREKDLKEFAARHDTIIFVSGRNSSNGKILFETCRMANPSSRTIENPDELQEQWFTDSRSVGICGATSTPRRLMEQVADRIKELNDTL